MAAYKRFVDFHGELLLLLHWSLLAYTGLVKILKKHLKRTGLPVRAPQLDDLLSQPFCSVEVLASAGPAPACGGLDCPEANADLADREQLRVFAGMPCAFCSAAIAVPAPQAQLCVAACWCWRLRRRRRPCPRREDRGSAETPPRQGRDAAGAALAQYPEASARRSARGPDRARAARRR